MEEARPGPSANDNTKKANSDNQAGTGASASASSGNGIGRSFRGAPLSVDVTLRRFKTQVMNLCDYILKAAISYVDSRICIQSACRMKDLYDNNRPHPQWWNDPRAQELLRCITNLKAMEEHLQSTKEFIKKQKDILLRIYDEMRQLYTHENLSPGLAAGGGGGQGHSGGAQGGMSGEHKEQMRKLMIVVNIKVLHVMTAMELILAADNRTEAIIDATVRFQLGITEFTAPAPSP